MRTDLLDQILSELNGDSEEIKASAVVSLDGLAMFSSFPSGLDEDQVAAMSAAMLSLAERTTTDLTLGTLEQVLVRGSQGCMLMVGVSTQAVLTVLTKPNPTLDPIFLNVTRAAGQIANLI